MSKMELRCGNCKKLLCRIRGNTEIEVSCPRCGTLNIYDTETRKIKLVPKTVRNRQTSSGATFS